MSKNYTTIYPPILNAHLEQGYLYEILKGNYIRKPTRKSDAKYMLFNSSIPLLRTLFNMVRIIESLQANYC